MLSTNYGRSALPLETATQHSQLAHAVGEADAPDGYAGRHFSVCTRFAAKTRKAGIEVSELSYDVLQVLSQL